MAWLGAVVAMAAANSRAWLIATRDGFALPPHAGFDLWGTYLSAAQRFLDGHGFYYDWQLAGPYDVWFQPVDPILYPPTMIPLFAAFTVLPAWLYWAIPLGVIGACIWSLRPRPLALALCLLLAVWPNSLIMQAWFGNPTMWIVAALAVTVTGRRWAAPFVLLKPTLAPFAAWGIRSRSWWIGLAALVAISLPFLPEWLTYASVLQNARNGEQSSLLYSIWNVPAMLIPVVAWLGSSRGTEPRRTPGT